MSGGGIQRHSRAEEEEEHEEDFYDCPDTLEPPDPTAGGEESQQDVHFKHTQTERGDTEREAAEGHRGEERGDRLKEEEDEKEVKAPLETEDVEQGEEGVDGVKEEEEVKEQQDGDSLHDSDTELKEESRRQQSISLKEAGNAHFKRGDWAEAGRNYTDALSVCPVCFSRERAVLFSNRAAARLHLDLKEQAISDCSRAIALDPDYLRALLRRAELYEQTEKLDEALEDYQKVLERDPNNVAARQAAMRLPLQIQERNEKLKEEMLSKLKDLGNMVLRPFGLSTNNFQVNQDAASGAYSINFIQNPNNNNR
ncbi:tetratricopeptide repeat protein 1 isoform X2 [Pundamilia nyererei]|uniref:Tetratricopeptide repeat protein 1 n=1 Tax=Pundamilia nyererei TaxID=303518 RepID=A0A9Y3S1P4_9CICH|nr:PREDICTED: tetratricopeptide repeat protein 1 isoform X2 [Pundamilia nyererei]